MSGSKNHSPAPNWGRQKFLNNVAVWSQSKQVHLLKRIVNCRCTGNRTPQSHFDSRLVDEETARSTVLNLECGTQTLLVQLWISNNLYTQTGTIYPEFGWEYVKIQPCVADAQCSAFHITILFIHCDVSQLSYQRSSDSRLRH